VLPKTGGAVLEHLVDPYQTTPAIHPGLPPLRLVNRRTLEHAGPCPFCGGDAHRSDRFRVWLESGKERFWCRACNEKGPLRKLLGEDRPARRVVLRQQHRRRHVDPVPTDAPHYRALYAAIALWAHANLLDLANPDPLAYLHQRGINEDTIARGVLGVTRRDPAALADHLRHEHAELLPYAEAAGVLVREGEAFRTHANLCGCLVFPYIANGEVVDLRTRTYPGKGYRSLAGGYESRGATSPFGWDDLGETDTVILTEGEIKALLATQAHLAGRLSAPALAHPGLSYLREEWGAELLNRGVSTVVLAYDSQPRPLKEGILQLAPEEIWSIRHGQALEAAGLNVRLLRLPLAPGETKADLDEFLLEHGPARLQHLLDTAPTLDSYRRSLPRHLLLQAKLPPASTFPLRRARPQRLEQMAVADNTGEAIPLADARAHISDLVRDHALGGQGFLLLAHPPGTGKGHNTVAGLKAYLQIHPEPGQIFWSALRKEQIHDQAGLDLIPLHGRNAGNCRKLGEAQALAANGYSVRETLCMRRCPFVGSCAYLRQFGVEADFFAPQPLLQATGWWQEASVGVLDEFDPSRLTRTVQLDSADLARMAQRADEPYAHSILRWVSTLLGTSGDRALSGALLLAELTALARADGLDLAATLRASIDALPDPDAQHTLPGFPNGATLSDYQALPPNYLETLLHQLDRELLAYQAGRAITSRLEVAGGRLWLYLRIEHLIQALARPEQPKIILDATANEALLQAIFPGTLLQLERPRITGGAMVTQVITRDWAKSTLRGARKERWYDEVAQHIRPGRPTLVVCTLACEEGLREALAARGHAGVCVAHYGALRGSNSYKGFDVLLAQVYHPNLDAIVREGRALFADDAQLLDERVAVTERTLTDATGVTWVVQVPTFVDPRLAALLEQRRESELVQAALRGRPFDHPETQITLLFGLPLPQLPPTTVSEGEGASPTSNASRAAAARATLAGAAQELLSRGLRVVGVEELAQTTGLSVVTIRKHLPAVAGRQGLRLVQQRRVVTLPKSGQRAYERWVLMRRGRWAPPAEEYARVNDIAEREQDGIDHADNREFITRVIRRRSATHRAVLITLRCDRCRQIGRRRRAWRRR
jgi:hypothetical protein